MALTELEFIFASLDRLSSSWRQRLSLVCTLLCSQNLVHFRCSWMCYMSSTNTTNVKSIKLMHKCYQYNNENTSTTSPISGIRKLNHIHSMASKTDQTEFWGYSKDHLIHPWQAKKKTWPLIEKEQWKCRKSTPIRKKNKSKSYFSWKVPKEVSQVLREALLSCGLKQTLPWVKLQITSFIFCGKTALIYQAWL